MLSIFDTNTQNFYLFSMYILINLSGSTLLPVFSTLQVHVHIVQGINIVNYRV